MIIKINSFFPTRRKLGTEAPVKAGGIFGREINSQSLTQKKMSKHLLECTTTERKGGMSIIETLIFIAIISIVLVTLTGITASMMRQMRINYNKIYATHYAEELADWLRVQKDVVGWSAFYLRATGLATSQTSPALLTRSFCVNSPITLTSTYAGLLPAAGTCPASPLGITDATTAPKIYKRSVEFSQTCSVASPCSNARGIRAKIVVQWIEAGGTNFQVEINTIYAPL